MCLLKIDLYESFAAVKTGIRCCFDWYWYVYVAFDVAIIITCMYLHARYDERPALFLRRRPEIGGRNPYANKMSTQISLHNHSENLKNYYYFCGMIRPWQQYVIKIQLTIGSELSKILFSTRANRSLVGLLLLASGFS